NQTGMIAAFGVAAGLNALPVTSGYNYLEVGMVIDIMDVGAEPATIAVNRTITAMNDATTTVTIDGAAVTTAAGDYAVRQGNYGKEPHGLRSLVSNTTAPLFNLSSTDEPLWQSIVDTTGGALSE